MPHCAREGRPAPMVEMLLTTPISHGRLQLQVERSAVRVGYYSGSNGSTEWFLASKLKV